MLPHLTRFVARLFAGHPHFCLAENLTIGLAIGGAVSITGKVIVGLLG